MHHTLKCITLKSIISLYLRDKKDKRMEIIFKINEKTTKRKI